jgi:hypothetical protein
VCWVTATTIVQPKQRIIKTFMPLINFRIGADPSEAQHPAGNETMTACKCLDPLETGLTFQPIQQTQGIGSALI